MPAGLDGNPNPISTPQRDRVLGRVADEVSGLTRDQRPLLVGIDGIDGAGKSTFADELAARLVDLGRPVVRATIDSFHQPRAVRWSKGRTSPVGFYLDSHDLAGLRTSLLDPLRSGGGATYRTAVFDEPSDRPVDQPGQVASGRELLIFDGIFLCRPELTGYWDLLVFLDAKARVDLDRLGHVMAEAPAGGTELVDHVLAWVERIDRYAAGMRYYLDSAAPMMRADLVIDNNDLAQPVIVEPGDGTGPHR